MKLNYKIKKWTSCITTFLMVISLLTPGAFSKVKAEEAGKIFDIIGITDFHGSLEDASTPPLPVGGVIAKNIQSIKESNPNRTLIIGGGDLYQGSPLSNVLFGVPVQKLMSNIGMEVTALGNHEFDWGLDKIINTTMKDAKYSIVCSNLYDKNTGKRVFEPYKIVEKDGVKIAVIGAITMETPGIVLPDNVANYKFTDPVEETNKVAKEIKDSKKADVILLTIHEGSNLDCKTGPVIDMAEKIANVDAILGGHSHTAVQLTSKSGMPVVIGKSNGKGFIDLKMSKEDGKVKFLNATSSFISIDNKNSNGYKATVPITDKAALDIVAEAKKQVGPTFSEVIGNTQNELTRKQNGSPYGESYLGNWTCDVMRNKAGADIAFQNSGGIRSDIPKGDITVGSMYYYMPFDNELVTVNMTKEQVKKVFEQAFTTEDKGIQTSGAKVTYDMSKPVGSRVVSLTREDGTAIPDNAVLKIATNDFLATGGDGYATFNEPSVKKSSDLTHILIRDILIENIRNNKTIKAVMNSRISSNGKVSEVKSDTITIVGTSDIHGNVYPMDYNTGKSANQGLAKVSSYVKSVRNTNPNTMLVDSGDLIQGTPLTYYFNKVDTTSEYPMIKVMGAMKYDSWTLGNHEFNYGLDTLNRILKDANKENIPVLSANTYKTTDDSNFVKPYTIKVLKVNGKDVKVGILGLTTKCIPSWENASNYEGLKFNDLVDEAKKYVPILKDKEKANIIVATVHSGEETDSDTIPENQIKALASSVDGIDAIICGHAHKNISSDVTVKNPSGKIVPITEPGKWGQAISRVDIKVKSDGSIGDVTTKTVAMDDKISADKEILDLAKNYQDAALKYTATVLGKSADEFKGQGQTIKPTAIMELINKVQMKGANTQLSIAAPLSSSAYIPKDEVTIQNIMGVYVFENFLYGIKMNGEQLKKWMEFSARYYKQTSNSKEVVIKDSKLNIPDYNLDQLYGATYEIDLSEAACTIDSKTGVVTSGNRIKNLKVNGKEVQPSDQFTVAVNNYRFNGGGGFMKAAGLKAGDNSIVVYDSAKALGDDGQVRNMMFKYIQENKTISAEVSNNWKINNAIIPDYELSSVKGNDRYETAVNLSKSNWDKGSEYAIIANGENFADALCAVPLAKKYNAPIILTETKVLTALAKTELERLGVKHVVIVGGDGVVSKSIEQEISLLKTKPSVKRISGLDRFETSVNIANELGSFDKAVFAYGYNYADAMSVASIAAAKEMPIILTEQNKLPDNIKTYINNKKPSISYVIGLEASINKDVEKQINEITRKQSVRIGGNDRFATNIAILKHFNDDIKCNKIFMAIGQGPIGNEFADALSGAAVAAKDNSPLVLIGKDTPEESISYVNNNMDKCKNIITIGGAQLPSAITN